MSAVAPLKAEKDYKLLDGKGVAAEIRREVGAQVAELAGQGWSPRLVSICVGDTDAAAVYIRNQKRGAEQVGIAFEDRFLPEDVSQGEVLAAIRALNADPRVTGVILQRPVPKQLSIKALQSAVHPLKDVEGMHPASIGNIVYNELALGPCTSMAAVELLKRTGLKLEGLEVVVIGHSEIVGKPIAFLLMAQGATVTVCHHMTHNLAVHTRQADAVFVAVGRPALVTGNMIKPGAALIDIGINQVVAEDGGTRLVGDADFASCHEVAGWITPVPGGVGPVTVAMLMRNTVTALRHQKRRYEEDFTADDLWRR